MFFKEYRIFTDFLPKLCRYSSTHPYQIRAFPSFKISKTWAISRRKFVGNAFKKILMENEFCEML